MTDIPNRQQRRKEAAEQRHKGRLGQAAFVAVADRFIDLANRENETVPATDLHLAFLWASTRYSAHVAKAVLQVENHETFVAEMTRQFQDMLRQHLSDPTLDPPS